MTNPISWHEESFKAGLTQELLATLQRLPDCDALAAAVTECAAAAETICCGRPMACAAHCPYCCLLNVAVLLPEALIVAQWLRERLAPSELDEMQKRLATHRSWARWMDDEERILKHMACPLLDGTGSCSVHPVRPLACRAITSLDSSRCREAFAPVVTEEEPTVPADLLRKAVYDAAFVSLAEALRASGLDDRSIELGTGVLAFLEHPEYRELLLGGGKLPHALWLV